MVSVQHGVLSHTRDEIKEQLMAAFRKLGFGLKTKRHDWVVEVSGRGKKRRRRISHTFELSHLVICSFKSEIEIEQMLLWGWGVSHLCHHRGCILPDHLVVETSFRNIERNRRTVGRSNPSELSRVIRTQHINARATETKYKALHIAVKFGQVEGVRQLIAAEAHINKKDVLGQTPLTLACCYDVRIDIPKQLLDADAKKNRKDKYSWRPIFWAAFRGYYNVVKLLIDYGAKKNKKDKHGKRPRDVTTNQQKRALLH